MADRYYVGSGSDWNTDANWSTSSGGSGGSSYPIAGDTAYFDANSGNCTLDAAAACAILDMTGYTGAIDFGAYAMTISGNCTLVGGLTVGAGTWTVGGNFDSSGVTSDTTNASWLLKLTGTSKTFTIGTSQTLMQNVTISDDSGGATYATSESNHIYLNGALIVEASSEWDITTSGGFYTCFADGDVTIAGTLDLNAVTYGHSLICRGDNTITINGQIDSVSTNNYLFLCQTANSDQTLTGTGDINCRCWTNFEGAVGTMKLTITGSLTFTLDLQIRAVFSGTFEIDTSGITSLDIQHNVVYTTRNVDVTWTTGTETINLSRASSTQSINFINGLATLPIINHSGGSTVSLTGDLDCDGLEITGSGTFNAATYDVDLGTDGLDMTGSTGSLDFGSGDWTISGDVTLVSVVDYGTGTVTFNGSVTPSIDITGLTATPTHSGAALWIIDGNYDVDLNATNARNYLGGSTGSGGLTINSSKSLTINAGGGSYWYQDGICSVSGTINNNNSKYLWPDDLRFKANGTFNNTGGSGIIIWSGRVGVSEFDATFTCNVSNGLIIINNSDLAAGDYGCAIEIRGGTCELAAGTYEFTSFTVNNIYGATTLDLTAGTTINLTTSLTVTSVSTLVINSTAANTNWTIPGNIIFTETSGSITWNKGTGTITLNGTGAQSIDTDNKALEDIVINKASGDTTLTSALTTDSFTGTSTGTGKFDPNGQTLTIPGNCSWASAFDFLADADALNGCTWDIGGNFTADGQTLNASASWALEVDGTAVASGTGAVAYSDASGFTEITASAGPWTDNGNNSNWDFGGAPAPSTGIFTLNTGYWGGI
jgi:hypothetical protein